MPKPNPKANPKSRSRSRRSPADPLDELAQELALAVRLDRASILFVVAATEAQLTRGAKQLAEKVRASGHDVQTVHADRVPDGDIPMMLQRQAKRRDKIYFVQDLERGGDRALRALNIRREYFSELRARVVFWLTPTAESALARGATDFWSFRHRTVYLAEPNP